MQLVQLLLAIDALLAAHRSGVRCSSQLLEARCDQIVTLRR
jgi:hypothetical protein